jgi:hypothetical protein
MSMTVVCSLFPCYWRYDFMFITAVYARDLMRYVSCHASIFLQIFMSMHLRCAGVYRHANERFIIWRGRFSRRVFRIDLLLAFACVQLLKYWWFHKIIQLPNASSAYILGWKTVAWTFYTSMSLLLCTCFCLRIMNVCVFAYICEGDVCLYLWVMCVFCVDVCMFIYVNIYLHTYTCTRTQKHAASYEQA